MGLVCVFMCNLSFPSVSKTFVPPRLSLRLTLQRNFPSLSINPSWEGKEREYQNWIVN